MGLNNALHIGPRDPTAHTCTGERGHVDSVVSDQSPDDWRQDQALDNRSRFGRWCGRRGQRRRNSHFDRRRSWGSTSTTDTGENLADLDHRSLDSNDFEQGSGHRRGNLRIDLVGRHLKENLIHRYRVTHILEPSGDRSFSDRLTQLGHRDVSGRCPSSRR